MFFSVGSNGSTSGASSNSSSTEAAILSVYTVARSSDCGGGALDAEGGALRLASPLGSDASARSSRN
ncbi:hypothetical protein EYF80_039859 [Liparis tanakae]|uniref:Uncharacterized protein n=1 Tax=Liparis tanakae TaxID=230148 RepID=A0A4Z2GBB9_9TELE|nr:hypothetical protein EYF80_039859 [Liparis tanakae]